jgi:uncharacterized protein with HEPN domain
VSGTRLPEWLHHIHAAALDACSFIDGMSNDDFLSDRRTQKAVVMSLVFIDEAAAKIMDRHSEFAVRHANVPWREMRGMRNRIAHGYFEIDLNVVWETARTALPALLTQVPIPLDETSDERPDTGQ